ncbi:hypothetical protein [Caryophanon latum]|uniref:Uncharacterized protein n=1 Tax=Caryophanon latum TaxID=33977 RepID=A0A1C0YQ11_9BACL|nr:hypothetical protein [Caryophanon latum]OCS89242.1 hypothetical protein A6K76_12895 [Caryophanon latum]
MFVLKVVTRVVALTAFLKPSYVAAYGVFRHELFPEESRRTLSATTKQAIQLYKSGVSTDL